MQKFKVIALSVGADSNRIFSSGEIVNADAWGTAGTVERLVAGGFIEPYEEPAQEASSQKDNSGNTGANLPKNAPKKNANK